MKVLLMTPPFCEVARETDVTPQRGAIITSIKNRLGFAQGVQPPFGLMYISAVLKDAGHRVSLVDGTFHTLESLVACAQINPAPVVGVSTVTFNWEPTKALIAALRSVLPQACIVVGGAHATAWREHCLEESPGIDVLVYGEGERTMLEVMSRLANGEQLDGTEGTILRRDGQILINPPRPYVKDLDELPFPDRDSIDISRDRPSPMFYCRLPHTSLFGSRGCPYRCTFCASEKKVRLRTPENMVDEMELAVNQYGVRDITFYDETFTLSKQRALAFCKEVLRRGVRVSWSVNARVDTVDLEILQWMKKAGCWRVLYGIESGVQRNLDTLRKGITLGQVQDAVRATREAGLEVLGMFMFGVPGETFADGEATIRLAIDLDLDYAIFSNVTPFPGTELYEQVKDSPGFQGIAYMTPLRINYVPDSMSKAELQNLIHVAYRRFYMNPRYVLKVLRKLRSPADFVRHLRGFLMLL